MTFRQIIRPGDTDTVPPHEHDAGDISGVFNFLRALKAVVTSGALTVGKAPALIIIDTATDQYRIIDGATDYFADAVIELSADWSNPNVTTHAVIATYDAQSGPGAPYVFLAGPHAGTEIADAARIALGIQDAGNEDPIAFLAAKKIEIAGNDFGVSLLIGGDPNDTSGAAADTFGFETGGVLRAQLDSDKFELAAGVDYRQDTPATTGSAADAQWTNVTGTIYELRRVTSALKYKSRITKNVDYLADITLTPTKHYRPDDSRWRYGLIADWLADQDPLLGEVDVNGEVENYDTRAVIAVMAAKINRLEARLAELEKEK